MVRINFDQFLWLAEQEANKLDTTVKPIYYSAYRQLSDTYAVAAKDARETEALEEPDRSSYLDWLAEEYRQQRGALAAMTFALLATTVNSHLKSILGWIGNRFPLQFPAQGPSELDRIVAQYRSRFGIGLEGLSHFATVREVVLARNSVLHNEGQPSGDYMAKTERRCLDDVGNLNLTTELLETFVEELKQFITELGIQMSRLASKRTAPTL